MKPLNVYRSSSMDDLGLIHFDLAGPDEALFSPIHPAALQYVDAALPSAQAGARWVGLGAPVQENETKAAETPAPVDQAVQSVSEGQAPDGQDQDLQAPQNGIHLTPDFTPADPDFSLQWHLNNTLPGQFDLNILDVWDDYTGSGVQVTIIADGFDLTHEDLDANWLVSLDYDYQGSSNDPTGDPATDLKGTAVAGIIGAEQGNGAGGVGVAFGAKMVGYKGLAGHVYAADMILDAAGLGDGTGNTKGDADGSDIINISVTTVINFDPWLATPDRMAALETVSAEGRDGLGAILVAANGDQRGQIEGTTSAWSSSKYTISVAAVRADGWVTDYSTQGANLLVSAFADTTDNFGGIYTTDRSGEVGYSDGDYAPAFDGTAAAGAQISGVVALMLEANPDLGWRDVQDILAYSARHVGSNVGSTAANFEEGTQTNGASWFFNAATNWNGGGLHFSNDYGFGLVDAKAAVRLAET